MEEWWGAGKSLSVGSGRVRRVGGVKSGEVCGMAECGRCKSVDIM